MNPLSFRIRSFELGVDQTLVLDAWRASELLIEAGSAWVTIENDPHDRVLRPGDRLAIGAANVRLQGLEASRVALVQGGGLRRVRLLAPLARVRAAVARRVRGLQLGPIADDARS